MVTRTACAALLLFAATLAAACGDESPPAEPAATDTPSATPTAEASPTATGVTPAPDGRRAIIAESTSYTDSSGYSARRATIRTFDVASGAELSSFELDVPLRGHNSLLLQDNELHAVTERTFDAYALDGGHLRTMVEVPADRLLLGAALSPDGKWLAHVHTGVGELTIESIADTHLAITDAATGDVVIELAQDDPKLQDGFYGQMWSVRWSLDSSYVVVDPVTHSDSPSPYAVVGIDGTVAVPTRGEEMQIGTEVEPGLRAAVVGFQYLDSGDCSPRVDKDGNPVVFTLRWVELPASETIATTTVPQQPYASLWSPDGSEMIFARVDCPEDTAESVRTWFRWSPGMAGPERVDGPVGLWRDWYGDDAVLSLQSDRELEVPGYTWDGYILSHYFEGRSFVVGDSPPLGEAVGDIRPLFLGLVEAP